MVFGFVDEEEAIAVAMDNKPGALGQVAEKPAQAKINIRYVHATTSEGSAMCNLNL